MLALFGGIVLGVLVFSAVGALSGAPTWFGLFGVAVGVYAVDQWYSLGARRLELLPKPDKPKKPWHS